MNSLDILAVGAHPDDVEIGMGGTLAKLASQGYKTGIVNLTKAELSSNGTVEQRQMEAEAAASVLQVTKRIQLGFPDRGLHSSQEECIQSLVKIFRQYKPKIVFAPNGEDRHPDHGHCGRIVKEAAFSSGIRNYLTSYEYNAWRPKNVYYYQINGYVRPDFIIDISEFIDTKIQALTCFESQFYQNESTVNTPLNDGFLERLKGRESIIGNEVGVPFGEGFISEKPMLISRIMGE
ncbi:bacillithiol biosynthesis deacetylase BshB1 [Evansella sp. AB-rgal1]|uniref:bacillithiol biosynthesis deacetylase BshB1 n=1 Tax=Evansella sp. AB-rgal1 TaxID=3242696 RepID=UPI00359DC596